MIGACALNQLISNNNFPQNSLNFSTNLTLLHGKGTGGGGGRGGCDDPNCEERRRRQAMIKGIFDKGLQENEKKFKITKNAAERIHYLNKKKKENRRLRIIVQEGDCGDICFAFEKHKDEPLKPFATNEKEEKKKFVEKRDPGNYIVPDYIFENFGVPVVIDELTLYLLRESTLEFFEDLTKFCFIITDNAAVYSMAECGCDENGKDGKGKDGKGKEAPKQQQQQQQQKSNSHGVPAKQ